MQKLLINIEKIADYAARIGGAMLLLCAAAIVLEVFLRKLANYSITGIDEYSGYALAIGVAISLPYTMVKRANIRVDAFYNLLPKKHSAILDWLSVLSLVLLSAFLVYSGYDMFTSSYRFEATANTPLGTPLWIPQFIWFFGFLLFLITCLIVFLISTVYLFGAKWDEIKALVGGKSIQEELDEEIANKKTS